MNLQEFWVSSLGHSPVIERGTCLEICLDLAGWHVVSVFVAIGPLHVGAAFEELKISMNITDKFGITWCFR